MALTEKVIIDKIEVLETGHIQVRQATVIERDGVELTRTFHRWTLEPGGDLSQQDGRVVSVAQAVWTEAVIAAYRAKQTATAPKIEP